MLIPFRQTRSVFSPRRWQPPARAILITERAGLVERQRGAGLVTSTARMPTAVPSVVPSHATSYGWRCPASAGSLQALSHSIRGRGCGMSRVTVAQRLVMGKVSLLVINIPYTGVFSKSLTAQMPGYLQPAVPVPPASDDPASVTARLCTLWCSCQNAAGRSTVIPGVSASTRACSSRP